MDRNLVLLNRNIARLRRDVRLESSEIEQLIAADLDLNQIKSHLLKDASTVSRPVTPSPLSSPAGKR